MPKIKSLIANDDGTFNEFKVSEPPVWVGGIWECGDRRFTDESGTNYQAIAPAPVPPTVGPNAFQFLWTIAEQLAIDELCATDKVTARFMKMLEHPRTLEVVMALPSIQNAIQHTLDALATKGTIAPADVPTRKAEILSGQMK